MDGQEEDGFVEENEENKCSKNSDSPSNLSLLKKLNMQIVFNKDRVSGMYKCQMCSYKSMHRSSIKSHYAVHSSLRPYACDQCSYEAKRLNDLRKHKLIKHGKKIISVRKKYSTSSSSFEASKINGVKSPRQTESDNNDGDDVESGQIATNQLLYHSLVGRSNGPVFPQPELASSPENLSLTAKSDIPDDLNHDDTVVVKPEPPDDYYTFQNKFPEHDESDGRHDVINIEENLSDKNVQHPSISTSHVDKLSTAKSNSIETDASPSVISLLLQKRNLTGSSIFTNPSNIQSKCLTGKQRNNVIYNSPLNLSSQPARSSSESSHSSMQSSSSKTRSAETTRGWTCDHCNILFFDSAIYFMHMGLHSPENAWQCNLCGMHLYDVYSFTSHFVNGHVSS